MSSLPHPLYTIPAHLPFAETLARTLLERYAGDPLGLSRALILLPSQRAGQALRDAFLRANNGKPMLLPRMQPLGEIDEEGLTITMPTAFLPPDWSPEQEFKRIFLLATLVKGYRKQTQGDERADHTMLLAMELAKLLDEVEREQLSLGALHRLVPEEFAQHWQLTVEFLDLLAEAWPAIAAEEQIVSSVEARNDRLQLLAEQWRAAPPEYPVIAAGTTGSIPATAQLLKVISTLPQGMIVLPGWDVELNPDYLDQLPESHAFRGMASLIHTLGFTPDDVRLLHDGFPAHSERVKLLKEIMRPAQTTKAISFDTEEALAGLTHIVCAHSQEEAEVIALILREAIEEPEKTAALVTYDRLLARSVAASLQRYGIAVDDSAGQPLMQTAPAGLMRLLLEVVSSNAAPVPLLSLLKHPLTLAGLERIQCLEAAREIELLALRGIRRPGNIAQLKAILVHEGKGSALALQLLDNLQTMLQPLMQWFARGEPVALHELVSLHMQCAEQLASEALWEKPEGNALGDFLSELSSAANAASPIAPADYPYLFDALLARQQFRPVYGKHPRLKILSPIEARLQSFDRMVIGGLNEGSWPPQTLTDPWFNRAMRESIGLPAQERRIGLSAHDFYMLSAAPEVFLTRSEKNEGVPMQASRWLMRLSSTLQAQNAWGKISGERYRFWAQSLDQPKTKHQLEPPAPTPPVSARPKKLSVTKISKWLRNPYTLYAEEILKLKPLEPLGKEPGASDFGIAVHRALERFVQQFPHALPADAQERLLEFEKLALHDLFFNPAVEALWLPRCVHIAEWFLRQEQERRPRISKVSAEVDNTHRIGEFLLTGRADRVEHYKDGQVAIVDYKTGTIPAKKDILLGFDSQLVLLALMLEAKGQNPATLTAEYWRLQGGERNAIKWPATLPPLTELIEAAKIGLARLIDRYNDPAQPYRAVPTHDARRAGDYDHLARVKEWN